jgi:hypothetical protein
MTSIRDLLLKLARKKEEVLDFVTCVEYEKNGGQVFL